MPPTLAAARKIASGRAAAIQACVGSCRRRSRSPRPTVRISQSSRASRRTSAWPTMPRWPATHTRLPFSGNTALVGIAPLFLRHDDHVLGDHLLAEGAPVGLVLPAELGLRLGGVADKEVDLRRAEVAWVDLDQHAAALGLQTLFLDP